MIEAALEAVVRRDRMIAAAALVLLTTMSWAYVLWLVDAMSMGGMEMPGIRMDANPFDVAMIPSLKPWSVMEFVFMFLMWTVMMVGMMTPSAAPMILVYGRVGREAAKQGKPLAATAYFAGGYLLAWAAFSLGATFGQWLLERASLLTPMMQSASTVLGGLLLIAAGIYQWTPFKEACLKHCQTPLMFIQRHGGFQRHAFGSFKVGFHHGLYCVGCCWALMALLFVGGVMNVVWIGGIAIFVLLEKVLPGHRVLPRIAGAALAGGGLWLIMPRIL